MMDLAELAWGRYNGGSVAPIGSYVNFRTLCIQQLASDGVLSPDGTFCRVDPSATQTFANIANTINAVLGTAYTAGSFHACAGGDNVASPGQMTDDA
jgi:hypothetical protein